MRLDDTRLREQIGREVTYTSPDPLDPAAFRYFAIAVGDRNPRYLDSDAASAQGYDARVAPPTLVCETNQYTDLTADRSGYVGHAWEGIPDEAVWIRGGNDYRFGRPVLPGDRLHVTWVLAEAQDVTTRDGRSMIRLVSEAEIRDVGGDFLAGNREIMYLADAVSLDG